MNKLFILLFVIFQFNAVAKSIQDVSWTNLAYLNPTLIEKTAKEFLYKKIPSLSGVEIRLVQINAQYHKNGPSLDITFIHANSMKPMSENKTLGESDLYGIKYYIEFIRIDFAKNGEPVSLNYQESLLGKTEKESQERFIKHFNFF